MTTAHVTACPTIKIENWAYGLNYWLVANTVINIQNKRFCNSSKQELIETLAKIEKEKGSFHGANPEILPNFLKDCINFCETKNLPSLDICFVFNYGN
jgi:hypothetical protein